MSRLESQILAILLNDTGPLDDLSLLEKFQQAFDVNLDDKALRAAVYQMDQQGLIFEIDPEDDFFDLAIVEHNELGLLRQEDYSVEMGLKFYTLGPDALWYISENKSDISDACRFAGFERASQHIAQISYDSSSWTGLPKSFEMNSVRKADLALLLKEAQERLRSSAIANSAEAIQADHLIGSALLLTEAPEPPADLIWANIGRAANLSGIGQILASVVLFFSGSAK